MGVIETEFDSPIEDDIVFEETDSEADIKSTLQNAENILKSMLYLKKLVSSDNPFINNVKAMNTVENDVKTVYTIAQDTGLILVKNIDDLEKAELYFNGGKFILFPFETIEFPVKQVDVIELNGKFSLLESEYNI